MAFAIAVTVLFCVSCSHGEESSSATEPYVQSISEDTKVAIIHTNISGSMKAQKPSSDDSDDGVMGLAAVSALVKDYESSGYKVLLLESGNALLGDELALLTEGEAVIEAMNLVGYDAAGIGFDDFSWGSAHVSDLSEQADFPFLAANITAEDDKSLFAQAHRVFNLGGVRVGVFGLCAPNVTEHYTSSQLGGLTFLQGDELYACAQAEVDYLKAQGCNLVVCLGSLNNTDRMSSTLMRDVVSNTHGIDLCIDGDNNSLRSQQLNGTLVVRAGHALSEIGVVLFENGVMRDNQIGFGTYDGMDAEVAQLVAQQEKEVGEHFDASFASSVCDLGGNDDPGVQTQETNLGDLVADSVLWKARQALEPQGIFVAASIVPGGCIEGSIGQGEMSKADIRTVLPRARRVFTVDVTGAQLLEALDQACASLPQATTNLPQVSNMTYAVDTAIPAVDGVSSGRVQIFDVAGQGFSLDAVYTIATYESVALGEGAFASFTDSSASARAIGCFDYQAMIDYIDQALLGTVGEGYRTVAGFVMIAMEDATASDALPEAVSE